MFYHSEAYMEILCVTRLVLFKAFLFSGLELLFYEGQCGRGGVSMWHEWCKKRERGGAFLFWHGDCIIQSLRLNLFVALE